MEKQLTIFDVNHPLNRRLQLAKEGGLYFETPRLVMMPMCRRTHHVFSNGQATGRLHVICATTPTPTCRKRRSG